ncbi:MAG: TIM barrel protein, partial [Oscillospiraceae bacterium]|nr:TIM barrel protein [Oscillospiraceae bacterium]
MKISFSTLACPNWTFSDVTAAAKDFGFDGIEIRGLGEDIFAVRAQPFSEHEIESTIRHLASLRLSIACFSSHACLKFADRRAENIEIVTEYIRLAGRLGTPFVRVLADLNARPDDVAVDDEAVLSQLRALAPIAAEYGVTLLVETNGVYSDTSRLNALLERVAHDAVAALWDIHHPYRFANETPEQTVQNLGAHIKYVHAKDSVVEGGEIRYRLMGQGDLPIEEMIRALRSINYEGYISLEWVKRWAGDLEDAGVVIPHYAYYMSRYTETTNGHGRLFSNRANTGHFIWEKESLIDLTFPQLLDRVVEEFPDQYAFRYTALDYTRTYREFRDDVDLFARSLISLGVKRGDKVAIWATNVPAWYITFWAATKIGAILVTVNTAYKIHEAEYLLRQSDTHTLVMVDGYKDSDYLSIIRELCPELATHKAGEPLHAKRLPFLRHIIATDSPLPGCLTWGEALRAAERTPIEIVYQRMATISRHDVCNMQYTSG